MGRNVFSKISIQLQYLYNTVTIQAITMFDMSDSDLP